MKKMRGVLFFLVAVLVGLAAVKAVSVYIEGTRARKAAAPVVTPKPDEPVRPPGFSETIPEGMRAVSIRVDDVSGVSRRIKKGDYVDIVATTFSAASGEGSIARLILQAVEVLETNIEASNTPPMRARAEKDWIVTLLVTPEEGASLAAAAAQAKIGILARPKEDDEILDFPGAVFSRSNGLTDPEVRLAAPNPVDLVRPGMRAVTVEIRDVDGICGRLTRGDRVDVIATSPFTRFASSGNLTAGATGTITEFRHRSITLLQNVEVLTVGRRHGVDNDKIVHVTLQLTPQDAERVAVASDASKRVVLRLVSRNPHDREMAVTGGQDLGELLTEKREIRSVPVYRGLKVRATPLFEQRDGY
jgi:Flp pilus assembly protein CpaB